MLRALNGLTVADVLAQLPGYTEQARAKYRLFTAIDYVFPVAGGLFIAAVAGVWLPWLMLASLFDWCENVAHKILHGGDGLKSAHATGGGSRCARAWLLAGVLALLPGLAGATNLVANGSFEAGVDAGLAIGRWYVDGLSALALDEREPADGRVSLRAPLSRFGYSPLTSTDGIEVRASRPLRLRGGRQYTLSAALRADTAVSGRLLLLAHDAAVTKPPPPLAEQVFTPWKIWRRVVLRYRPTADVDVYWSIEVRGTRPGSIGLDALQIEEGGPTAYTPGPVAATLNAAGLDRIFDSGAPPRLVLRAHNGAALPLPLAGWRLRLQGLAGSSGQPLALPATLGADGYLERTVELPRLPNGWWRAELLDGTALLATADFAILPRPRAVAVDAGAFGACATLAAEPLRILKRAGFTWLCLLTSTGAVMYWDMVEPERGRFRWYDSELGAARAAGFGLTLHLEPCRTPRWAERFDVDRRRALWSEYVGAMVRHYAPLVQYWTVADEVQNAGKPNSALRSCWTDMAGYAQWHAAGAAAIRAADPQARIILNARDEVVRDVLALLDRSSYDILGDNTWHVPHVLERSMGYGRQRGVTEFWAPGIAVLPNERDGTGLVAERRANQRIAAGVVTTLGLGVRRLFQYTATHVGNTNAFSIFAADSSLRPAGVQLATLAALLDGLRSARNLPAAAPLRLWRFDRLDGMTVFAIVTPAGGYRLGVTGLPAGQPVLDAYANPLPVGRDGHWESTEGVSFLVVPSAAAARLQEALATLRAI
ncbi:MAG: hypothetical protein FJ197_09205 [Gammaproteobacteria bacterium]|nr:hypothetical protein [Gammaproteobacteria bacterium]